MEHPGENSSAEQALPGGAEAQPKPIPFGYTRSGRHLDAHEAARTGIIFYRRQRHDMGSAFAHEVTSDLMAASSIVLMYARLKMADQPLPITPEDQQHINNAVQSLIATIPIVISLGVKWGISYLNQTRLERAYNRAKNDDELLERLLRPKGLLLENLPDKDEIDHELHFYEHPTSKGVRGFLKNTFGEARYYFTKQGAKELVSDIWTNHKRAFKSTFRYGVSNIAHIFHATGHYYKKTHNFLRPSHAFEIPSSPSYGLEIAIGRTAAFSIGTQGLGYCQTFFVFNEAAGGAKYIHSAFEKASSGDMGAITDGALAVLHMGASLFSVRPCHELFRDSSHKQGQIGGKRARLAALSYEADEHKRRIAEIEEKKARLEEAEKPSEHEMH